VSFIISNEAADDIENIWLYTIDTWSQEQADRYYNLLTDAFEVLSENPNSGREISQIRLGYRMKRMTSHYIFYRLLANKIDIEIVRVLHVSMDIENRLLE
jgi:toxin ParE1/3/4